MKSVVFHCCSGENLQNDNFLFLGIGKGCFLTYKSKCLELSLATLGINNYHLASFTVTRHRYMFPLLNVITLRNDFLPSLNITGRHHSSITITCHHSPSLPIIHYHFLSFTVTFNHLPSLAIVFHHSASLVIIHHHFPSFIITSCHSLSLSITCHL